MSTLNAKVLLAVSSVFSLTLSDYCTSTKKLWWGSAVSVVIALRFHLSANVLRAWLILGRQTKCRQYKSSSHRESSLPSYRILDSICWSHSGTCPVISVLSSDCSLTSIGHVYEEWQKHVFNNLHVIRSIHVQKTVGVHSTQSSQCRYTFTSTFSPLQYILDLYRQTAVLNKHNTFLLVLLVLHLKKTINLNEPSIPHVLPYVTLGEFWVSEG